MEFSTLIWIIVLTIGPLALVLFADAKGMFDDVGGGAFTLDELKPPPPAPGPSSHVERELEIRQLIQARSDRRAARGEAPLDVESEVERLLALDPGDDIDDSSQDQALRDEVRGLVIARNERRVARGQAPLDIEQEIDRRLRDAGA